MLLIESSVWGKWGENRWFHHEQFDEGIPRDVSAIRDAEKSGSAENPDGEVLQCSLEV